MPDLPSGTVTFLFTDIEGSTRLWERHPVAMQVALARHDALMRTVIVEHDGTVFKTVGDAFCAAFHTAADGLAAAGAAQRALAAESWPAPVDIKVRMALHTGAAEVRDNDYFGQPLNRVARLLSAGHGGQVLLSLAAQELVRDSLPPGVVLRDMGERRLKDLIRPERVYQVVVPQLPADFPPLNTLDARAHNLPVQATSFVGREREMAEVKALLASARLVTVTGAGGAGKTRLALQVGAERIDEYADGVWFVELAPLTEGRMVPQAVATALGVKEQPGVQVADTLARELKHKELLLLLDNCEHLVDACARLGEVLLGACAKVRVLATSREALRVPGEATYRVPSLATPDPKATPSIAALTQYAAVQLFIDRARAVQSTFEVNHQNAPALASICHHLDGIPLALELAAARVRSLSVEEINQRLDQRFRLLTGGARTALPRQQTLRAAIDWSYELLGAIEQALFARLAVFAGGWTLEAAERVCAGDPVVGADVLDLLTSLADKSLVLAEERNGATRYRLLETVRQYARDRLRERGEEPMWSSRHLAYFGALAEEAEPQLRGVQPRVWLDRLESEHDNLRAALAWSASAADANADAGLRLASLLWEFWSIRGYLAEGRNWFAALLAVAPHGPSAVRAKALGSAGNLARIEGDFPAARALYEECLALRRTMGDRRGLASSFVSLGILASDQGDYPAARMLYEEALQIYRDLDDRSGIAFTSTNLGITALRSGDYPAARTLHSESLALRQAAGDRLGISKSLNNLGVVAYYMNDYPAARARFEESLAVVRDLGDRRGTANALINLGGLASCQGDPVSARRFLEESLAISRELGSPASVGLALINLGDLASDQGDHASARALLAECLAIFRALGDHKNIATALNMLGTLAFEQGDQKGARAHYEEALAARQHLGDRAGVAQSLRQLGRLATVQRDYRAARILLEQSLTILVQMRDQLGVAALLEALARVAFALAQTDRAARLWGRAEGLREEIAMPLPPKDRPEYECLVAAARTVRGDDAAFDEAWREGRAMTLDQAIDYALVHPEAT